MINKSDLLDTIGKLFFQSNDQETREEDESNPNAFAEDVNEHHETAVDKAEDEAEQSEPELLEQKDDESFTEADSQAPVNGIESPPDSTEPVTNTANEQPIDQPDQPTGLDQDHQSAHNDDNDDFDDEMEVIHHDIFASKKHATPSKEEIQPLGLPIENKSLSKTTVLKKVSTGSTR